MQELRQDAYGRFTFYKEAVTKSAGDCSWCGTKPKRLFRYYIHHDDSTRAPEPMANGKLFCNSACFRAYTS